MAKPHAADPWRDTEVIDSRAPRFNQTVVGIVALASALLGWPLHVASPASPTRKVDVRERPDLTRKYGIVVVPAVFAVRADGTVLKRLAP